MYCKKSFDFELVFIFLWLKVGRLFAAWLQIRAIGVFYLIKNEQSVFIFKTSSK